MRKVLQLILIFGMILCTSHANAWWGTEKLDSFAKEYQLHSRRASGTYKITRIWVDEDLYAVFVDINGDGVEDIAHVHSKVFNQYWECSGDVRAGDFIENYITKYIKFHSC